jgi:Ser/Thr protein kinase RdoA (MazF antagonist)
MNETELLTDLIEYHYGAPAVTLRPIHQFAVAGRGIYQVEQAGKPARLLRAFRHEEDTPIDWLANSAATLSFLQQQGYPAPQVIQTTTGALISRQQDWSALMLTFVEGTMAQNTLENLASLATLLGQLHNLDAVKAVTAAPPVQGSRFQPGGRVADLLEQLEAIGQQVPADLRSLYDICLETLSPVNQWKNLPITLLHTDCWINNAIQLPSGSLVLVDWDGAGLGPAVLDLGYLLVACHIGLPEWPHLIPNKDRITTVMAGYCRQRRVTIEELDALLEAVRFSIIYHDARDFLYMLQDERLKNRNLQRFQVRYPAAEEITHLAKVRFEHYL